jgi:hypothetical protein
MCGATARVVDLYRLTLIVDLLFDLQTNNVCGSRGNFLISRRTGYKFRVGRGTADETKKGIGFDRSIHFFDRLFGVFKRSQISRCGRQYSKVVGLIELQGR